MSNKNKIKLKIKFFSDYLNNIKKIYQEKLNIEKELNSKESIEDYLNEFFNRDYIREIQQTSVEKYNVSLKIKNIKKKFLNTPYKYNALKIGADYIEILGLDLFLNNLFDQTIKSIKNKLNENEDVYLKSLKINIYIEQEDKQKYKIKIKELLTNKTSEESLKFILNTIKKKAHKVIDKLIIEHPTISIKASHIVIDNNIDNHKEINKRKIDYNDNEDEPNNKLQKIEEISCSNIGHIK